jgi:hypothetical protein
MLGVVSAPETLHLNQEHRERKSAAADRRQPAILHGSGFAALVLIAYVPAYRAGSYLGRRFAPQGYPCVIGPTPLPGRSPLRDLH